MKNLIIIPLFLSSLICSAQSDAVSKYFKSYADDQRFNTVYISPKMFQMVSKINLDDMDADLRDFLKVIKGLHILSTEINPQSFYKEAITKINTKEYEELMRVRDRGEDVMFFTKNNAVNNDKIDELLMLVGGATEFTLVSFVGDIDLNKIGKLGKTLNINGSEHLERINKKN